MDRLRGGRRHVPGAAGVESVVVYEWAEVEAVESDQLRGSHPVDVREVDSFAERAPQRHTLRHVVEAPDVKLAGLVARRTGSGLAEVDRQITSMRDSGQAGRRKLAGFADAVLACLDRQPETEAQDTKRIGALFVETYSPDEKRFIAICLLRLQGIAPASLGTPTVAGKMESLFDECLPDIYKSLGIDLDERGWKKTHALEDAFPRAEAAIAAVLSEAASASSSQDVDALRAAFRSALKAHGGLITTFLPHDLLRGRTNELFEVIREAFDADETTLIDRHQRAWSTATAYEADARKFGTRFAELYMADLAAALRVRLDSHKDAQTLRPAGLEVQQRPKKYPLEESERDIRLALVVANNGEGPAMDAELSIEAVSGLTIGQEFFPLGTIRSGTMPVDIAATTDPADLDPDQHAQLLGQISWRNADGSRGSESVDCRLAPQRTDIDWDSLARTSPYSLKPIRDPNDLIGRDELLEELVASMTATDMGSCIVSGQKRVGKTSIVRSLEARLGAEAPSIATAYLQVSPYKASVLSLYRAISESILEAARGVPGVKLDILHSAELPSFELGPSDLLSVVAAIRRAGVSRLLLVLDEFDELPSDLLGYTDEAGGFFNTLRDLTSSEDTALVLVGGENLSFVLTAYGSALNLVDSHRVDYFRREDQYSDYADLIRVPTAATLEFEADAVDALYEESAGHPYFTKMICRSVFALAAKRRDASITSTEIGDAVATELAHASTTAFSHFWDDGIYEQDAVARREVARKRRATLLAVGRSFAGSLASTREAVETEAARVGLDAADARGALVNLEQRGVLQAQDDRLRAFVPFFGRWLGTRGPSQIVSSIEDAATREALRVAADDLSISPDEVSRLVKQWGLYRSREVTTDHVRDWLHQFGGVHEQRRAFDLIQQMRFFTATEISSMLGRAHKRLTEGWKRALQRGQQLFTDILVVPLDDPGKSGYQFAHTYVVENRIHKGNVVSLEKLAQRISTTKRKLQAVVFVDDFVGTGHNAMTRLGSLDEHARLQLRDHALSVNFVVVAGFQSGLERLDDWLASEQLPISVHPQEVFGSADSAFGDDSRFFENDSERLATKQLFEELALDRGFDPPLGYGDLQAVLAFETGIPNNSLPLLWGNVGGQRPWSPLFARF